MKFTTFALTFALAGFAAANKCASNQFEYYSGHTGNCCLPKGGNPKPPQCPSDKECPSHWEWHGSFNCCVPQTPSQPPEPSCPHGPWDRDQQCCHKPSNPSPPPPNPSHGHRHKREERTAPVAARNWRSKTVSCPAGQTICNVSDDLSKSNTWACVDTQKDANFCGGCGTPFDHGEDCAAIPNSWNVGCNGGKCTVFTCEPGYYVGRDGASCHAL